MEGSLGDSVPVEEGPGAATAASQCPGAFSTSVANDEGQAHLLGNYAFATLYFFCKVCWRKRMGEAISICFRSRCLLETVKGKVVDLYCF